MTARVEVSGLRAYYQTRQFGVERDVRAVDDVSLAVQSNEIYGLAGESSCGKSTLIKTIAGAIRPPLAVKGGKVVFDFGAGPLNLYESGPDALAAIRWKHLSYVMQGSMGVLNPVRRVRRSFVDFAFRHIGLPMADFTDVVVGHLGRVHLGAEVLDAYPHELSGGMRQRVAIALATVCKPELIIADEPTTALDVTIQAQILYEAQKLCRESGTALIWITHDLSVVAGLADRICVMYAGRIVEQGSVDEVLDKPLHPYTHGLIGSVPSRNRRGSPLAQIPGMTPPLLDLPAGCAFRTRCPRAAPACKESPELKQHGNRLVRCFYPL